MDSSVSVLFGFCLVFLLLFYLLCLGFVICELQLSFYSIF